MREGNNDDEDSAVVGFMWHGRSRSSLSRRSGTTRSNARTPGSLSFPASNSRTSSASRWDDRCVEDPAAAAVTAARRAKAAIPDIERHRPKWEQAHECIDELLDWGRPAPPLIVADAGYGQTAEFRQGLTDRDLRYVLAVPATITVRPADAVPETPEWAGRGRRPQPRYRTPHSTVKQLVLDAGEHQLRHLTWRHGTRTGPDNPTAAMTSRYLALRVRSASRHLTPAADGTIDAEWLIAEWPAPTRHSGEVLLQSYKAPPGDVLI